MSETDVTLEEGRELLKKVKQAQRRTTIARFKAKLHEPRWVFWTAFKYLTLLMAAVAVIVPPYCVLMA